VAELSQQAQSVPSGVRIKNLPMCDVVNCDSLHGYFSARGRNIYELNFVSAGNNPGDNRLSLFGDHVFNRETRSGKLVVNSTTCRL
jgi:hypothetical protein